MAAAEDSSFRIGLALSGAISAGAYTAGVLDYLFQALNAWEWERESGSAPKHQVVVQAITGASAGAISGALGVVALARGILPQRFSDGGRRGSEPTSTGASQEFRCILPSLYEAWVTGPRMVDPHGGIDFLSSEDLGNRDARVVSALNSKLLDHIKTKALTSLTEGQPPAALPPYPYIAANLHVYMTVSNLRGIPFTVSFGNSTYGMQTHGDRVHYVIKGLGSGAGADNQWLANDSGRELTIGSLPQLGQPLSPEWDQYGTCALASSAFPVGLAPRELSAPLTEYMNRSYPASHGEGTIKPTFPKAWEMSLGEAGFAFLNVDGGVVNNNPFDYAQYAVMGDYKPADTSADKANRAVIMVSPFPEPPPFLPDNRPPNEIVAVLQALFPALIDQARFKPSELVPAMDLSDHSRFLIAPERNINGVDQRYKIACGLLSGFGGFLDERFRAHDFQLGRRNCQEFLRSIFGLSAQNEVVAALSGRTEFQLAGDAGKFPIVPRLGDALPEVALPKWPRMSEGDLALLMERIKKRLSRISPRLVQAQTPSRIYRALGRFGLWLGQRRILDYVRLIILADLVRREQIEGWELPDTLEKSGDDVRLVLAELVNPAFSFRTPGGNAKAVHMNTACVTRILSELEKQAGKPFLVWRGPIMERQVFTLASRRPAVLASLPVIRQAAGWIEAPAID